MMKYKSNRMIQRGICIFILIAVMLLSGCGGRGRGNEDYTTISTRYHTGSQGIFMQWVPNAPPNIVYDSFGQGEDEIVIQVELWNRGAMPSTELPADIYLYLGGFDPAIINLPTQHTGQIRLLGKSIYNSEGEKTVVQFPDEGSMGDAWISLPDGTDVYNPNIQLTACYEYTTEASPVVCLSSDPYKITTEQPCVPGQVTGNVGSQGAPVAVTSVIAENVRQQVVFKIHISNVGQGRVIDQTRVASDCPYGLDYIEMNMIDYEVSLQGSGDVTSGSGGSSSSVPGCTPDRIRLSNGQADLFCRFGITGEQKSAFQTPIQIKLFYGYMDSITKVIEIRNIK